MLQQIATFLCGRNVYAGLFQFSSLFNAYSGNVYQRAFDLYSFFQKNKELNIVLQFVIVFHWISSFETCQVSSFKDASTRALTLFLMVMRNVARFFSSSHLLMIEAAFGSPFPLLLLIHSSLPLMFRDEQCKSPSKLQYKVAAAIKSSWLLP